MELQQKITNEQLFDKMCEVQALLEKPKVEKGLWDIQDIANYCGFGYDHTYKNIITDPRFPAPIDLQGKAGSKRTKRLFIRQEVIQFFEKNKQRKYRL